MKCLLGTCSLLAAMIWGLSAHAADGEHPGLRFAIVAAKDKDGTPILDREAEFAVEFTNSTKAPVRLWDDRCQLGYETLSFLAVDQQAKSSRMYKRRVSALEWYNMPTATITIPPGASYSWKVLPNSIWGERVWKGVPEPSGNQKVTLSAVFESVPSTAATKHCVWTGRVTSPPVAVRVVDARLTTPHLCIEDDCPKLAIKMMEADPKWIVQTDNDLQTPLHVAAHYGQADVVRWLLSKGAAVNNEAYNEFTPLSLASTPEIVKLLIDHKANVNAKNASDRTVLQEAAIYYGHLCQYPEWAAEQKQKRAIIKLLLHAGATYDLLSACCIGDIDRVRVLVQDKKAVRDKEAMRFAVMYGRGAIVKLLLDHGADPEDADYCGLTLSYFAIDHPSVLKLLLDAGADPKVKVDYVGDGPGPENSTLLHEAAQKGALDSAKLLIKRGVDVNAKGYPRRIVPLQLAAWMGHLDLVRLLAQHGADVNAKDSEGKDAIDWANKNGADSIEWEKDRPPPSKMVELLSSLGCRSNAAKK
jgi:ankyrin repeat protein